MLNSLFSGISPEEKEAVYLNRQVSINLLSEVEE